jgi:hypothetical protein
MPACVRGFGLMSSGAKSKTGLYALMYCSQHSLLMLINKIIILCSRVLSTNSCIQNQNGALLQQIYVSAHSECFTQPF